MNSLIKMAVNICTWVYLFVGIFGYIAFYNTSFSGNILLSFRPSIITDILKIGFVLSLAFSFPLVILPCRASLYSLLYKGASYTLYESNVSYIPEGKFKLLTILIVSTSLVIGIIIPNIELVLGLVGSTIGVMICVLFPVTCFICIIPKNTNERILAQLMLFIGVIIMVLGTYANLYAFEEAKLNSITEKYESLNNNIKIIEKNIQETKIVKQIERNEKINVMEIPTTIKQLPATVKTNKKQIKGLTSIDKKKSNISNDQKLLESVKEVRHEPPQPEEPIENQISIKPEIEKVDILPNKILETKDIKTEKLVLLENNIDQKIDMVKVVKDKQKIDLIKPVDAKIKEKDIQLVQDDKESKKDNEVPKKVGQKETNDENLKKTDEVDIEAIKKEDTELKEQEKESLLQDKDTNRVLIDTIQKQNEVQKEIVEQQKKLIEVIQKQQESKNNDQNNNNNNNKDNNNNEDNKNNEEKKKIDKFNEVKLNAVKQIENIAKKAIESISNQDGKKNIELNEENQKEIIKQVENKIQNVNNELKLNLSIAPLLYQPILAREKNLTEKGNGKKEKKNNVNLLPLPIVMANNLSLFDTIQKNVTINSEKIEEVHNIRDPNNKNDKNNKIENATNVLAKKEEIVKDVRSPVSRDILSKNEDTLIRQKREINSVNSTKKNVKKTPSNSCEDEEKLKITKKPLVLHKLADEPNLIDINLNDLVIKDLISFKSQDKLIRKK